MAPPTRRCRHLKLLEVDDHVHLLQEVVRGELLPLLADRHARFHGLLRALGLQPHRAKLDALLLEGSGDGGLRDIHPRGLLDLRVRDLMLPRRLLDEGLALLQKPAQLRRRQQERPPPRLLLALLVRLPLQDLPDLREVRRRLAAPLPSGVERLE